MDKKRLDEIRARCEAATDADILRPCEMRPTVIFYKHAHKDVPDMLEYIERLIAALRQAELLCQEFEGEGNFDGAVKIITHCRVCHRKFRSWESGDEHAEYCVFAGI